MGDNPARYEKAERTSFFVFIRRRLRSASHVPDDTRKSQPLCKEKKSFLK